eukprot:TRINITY_DN47619_c0_g1_i1.p1 TRINITY_DN47619_c0_g1~~TRINITY_DN47619_c0_g1_i1.p1  ORF type:complete len:588 (+),score=151.51 TRINITY_DN47619_c0_g1_i1:68-1765(+)
MGRSPPRRAGSPSRKRGRDSGTPPAASAARFSQRDGGRPNRFSARRRTRSRSRQRSRTPPRRKDARRSRSRSGRGGDRRQKSPGPGGGRRARSRSPRGGEARSRRRGSSDDAGPRRPRGLRQDARRDRRARSGDRRARSLGFGSGWEGGDAGTRAPRNVEVQRRLGVTAEEVAAAAAPAAEEDKTLLEEMQRRALDANFQHHNDYAMNFFETKRRPQNFVRHATYGQGLSDYPQLEHCIKMKDHLKWLRATPPLGLRADVDPDKVNLQTLLGVDKGVQFDVILVDPPWEEYARRAPGCADLEWWPRSRIERLPIAELSANPSVCFLWCGSSGSGTEIGRELLSAWGFKRTEDIVWVKSNKRRFECPDPNHPRSLGHDTNIAFDPTRHVWQATKEHLLMGIKGVMKRNADTHFIHCNVDTDVLISEEPEYGSTEKPAAVYEIIEHFCGGRRRLELFGGNHNVRAGWVTVGKNLSLNNYGTERFLKAFTRGDPREADADWWDKDDVVAYNQKLLAWRRAKGVAGGNEPSPATPSVYLVGSSLAIEETRPQTPPAAGFKQAYESGMRP